MRPGRQISSPAAIAARFLLPKSDCSSALGERTNHFFKKEKNMKKQPLLTNNKRSVQMAVFEQTGKDGDSWLSVTIKRPYKDRSGQWQHGSYSREQLEAVVELALEAMQFIAERGQTNATA
jgi:hypothetical protein